MKNKIGILLLIGFTITATKTFSQKADFSYAEQSIKLSTGVRLQFVEKGDQNGIPVIFLHGITDSWKSYQNVLPLLPSRIHAYALSQRGHGNAERPAKGYLPQDFAADVAAFIHKKHLGRVIIVGHSMGSVVAQQFAVNYPHLVRGVVLIAADAAFGDNAGMPEFMEEVSKMDEKIDRGFMVDFQKATLARDIDPRYFETVVEEGMKVPTFVFKAALMGLMSTDLTSQLNKINVPVLVVWGAKDNFCSATDQYLLMSHIKNAKEIIYEEAGHALHWEQPVRFARDLADFVGK